MAAAIHVENLTKSYGDREVLKGLSLEVQRGSCTALLGPNGAGKTTTVEILEGYRSRSGGEISVLGTDPASPSAAWKARIGIVLQTSTDVKDLSCNEVLEAFGILYPTARTPGEVLTLIGLEDRGKARVKDLSGGQRRRLDVGLGIVGRPELLFLDEPTTGFDAEARRQFWSMIEGLKAEGTTIVLTTHYLDEAEALADDVAIIGAGRIMAQGAPQKIGSRDHDLATVRWRNPDGLVVEEQTDRPDQRVAQLMGEFGALPDLTVTKPTLEDVYLRLIHEADGASS